MVAAPAVEFQQIFLQRNLWNVQEQICTAIQNCPQVSVKGCHGSGKTFCVAGAALDFAVREGGKVLWIAPTLRQVKVGLDEVATAAAKSKINFPEVTATSMQIGRDNYIRGFSASKGINAQSFHGEKILVIEDEAPGIQADVHDAVEGIRASGQVKVVRIGNPTIPSGTFYEDFGRNKQHVHGITISVFDTPNLAGTTIEQILSMSDQDLEYAPFPMLARRRWVREMYQKWGPNHPSYQARVLGQFPTQSRYSVFPADAVYNASRPPEDQHIRDLTVYDGVIQVGLDVAGSGDDETAVCARAGQVVLSTDAWVDADARAPVLAWLSKIKHDYPRAQLVVMVDVIGIGYHFATWLADQGYDVRGFMASGKAMDSVSFLNAKAEAYMIAAEWLKRGVYGVTDAETQAQLIGIQYEPLTTGSIKIEDKEDAKKRGLSSPDRAEALVLSFVPLVAYRQRIVWE